MFSREDWTLFRSLNTLPQKAGIDIRRLGALVVKELVDNALDAGAVVTVKQVDDWVFINDDGPGISHEGIEKLFSINRPLISSKVVRLPTRGALGNGLRVVMGAVYASGGEIIIETGGQDDDPTTFYLEPQDDGHTRIIRKEPSEKKTGTLIRLRLGAAIPTDSHSLTSLADISVAFSTLGKTYQGKTSPWWYDTEAFFEMCHAAGSTALYRILMLFRDIKRPEAEMIADKFTDVAADITRDQAAAILKIMRAMSKEPKPAVLGGIGELKDEFRAATSGIINAGTMEPLARLPYSIEAFCSPLEEQGDQSDKSKDQVILMVNRTQIVGNLRVYRGKPTELYIFGCGLQHGFKLPKDIAVRLIVNITTPYMPITTDGKEPDLKRYAGDLIKAIEKAAGKCKRANRKQNDGEKLSQKDYIEQYLEDAVAKTSSNGTYRYSLRQLYYAIRPHLLPFFEKGLDYNYFASVVTQIESDRGRDLPGMYRDARGVIYHPHTHEEIPLGTLSVEEYKRPAWTFNKILYIEKKGFFPLLQDVGWPERNDCALMTSQGFASRAARDVLDMLGEGDEEIFFFCIHDADASGTMIYQSLIEATKARSARTVHVVNLGLDPEEADKLGLQVETFRASGGRKLPVANYVDYDWVDWLQTQRVELNAIGDGVSEEFVNWLDSKFAPYAGKVIPPEEVMEQTYKAQAEEAIMAKLTDRILREADLVGQVAQVSAAVDPTILPLRTIVTDAFEETPELRWDKPLADHADERATELVAAHKPKAKKKSSQ